MGLDLCVEGCAKPGFEDECRDILQRSFSGDGRKGDKDRFDEISVPAYQNLAAPRVGENPEANEWLIKASGAEAEDEIAELLAEHDGYYVLDLVPCDGLPRYTHAGLFDQLDKTSFRGSFLKDCSDVLSEEQIDDAWDHKLPEDAVAYGETLLLALKNPINPKGPKRPGLLSWIGLGSGDDDYVSMKEQRKIVESAGRWYIFWGKRGHSIRAWY